MNAIFSLSAFPLLLAVLAFVLASLCLALAMLEWSRRRSVSEVRYLPVPPFFTAITTAWGLSLGFVAADLWTLHAHAEQAASAERSSISRLVGMAAPEALDLPDLHAALAAYSVAVRDSEWGKGEAPAPAVENALQAMRLALVGLARDTEPTPLVEKMAQDFDELQDARNARLALGIGSISTYKWYLVMALTVLALIAIAAAHGDRPPAGRISLGIFSATAVVCLWIVAMHANPYAGGAAIGFSLPAP